jgi:hypothetical protein
MVSSDEFEALKKRVSDLELIATELLKTFQSTQAVIATHASIVEKVPQLMEHLSTLVIAVEGIQNELESGSFPAI